MLYLMFETAYMKIKTIKHGLAKFGNRVTKWYRLTLRYQMAYTCFALARYNEALDHLMPLIQNRESAVDDTAHKAARMLQLLCHFEKGDKILLDSLVKSIQRSILGKGEEADAQRISLTFIHSSLRKNKITRDQWIAVQNKLDKLPASMTDGTYNEFNYKAWARAHAEGISFPEAWS